VPIAPGDRPVGVDEGFIEEGIGLLLPEAQPGFVDGAPQRHDILFTEAASEVPGGGRVADAPRPEGIEVDPVDAPDLEVFEAVAARQRVVGYVQDVVALVIPRLPLQKVEALVDIVDQSGLPGHEVDGSDAAGRDGPSPFGDLGLDIGGGHHRLGRLHTGLVLDAAKDSPLATSIVRRNQGFSSFTTAKCLELRLIDG
jgi:hypothetical protein